MQSPSTSIRPACFRASRLPRARSARASVVIGLTVSLALLAGPSSLVPSAHAVVGNAQVIDGPAIELRELGGVAMAADGTGGVVFRKEEAGRTHVFASQFNGAAWSAPQRVDVGSTQTFDSSWPVIAAGDGGRLVVVWVQEFGVADRMYSAALQPGARRFQSPVPVDINVGDSTLGIAPSIAMAPGGQALVTYRVVVDAQPAGAADGGVLAEIRAARFTGELWSSLGTPMNRNLAAIQPAPTAANGPQVGIDQSGSGVVAWQELDDELIARVYARRLFSTGIGIAQQVTPREIDGVPTRDTNAFALATGPFGEAAIAWRGVASAADGAQRIWTANLPDQFAKAASAFSAPRLADGGTPTAVPAGTLGRPNISISGPDSLISLSVGATAQTIDASETDVAAAKRIDAGDAAADPGTVGSLGSDGAAALAWKIGAGGRGAVRLQERRSDDLVTDKLLTGPRGGIVDDLRLAGSGTGDGIAAFTQGVGAGRQLVVGVVDAPAQTFSVQAPIDWVSAKSVKLSWDPAKHAIGSLSYAVVVDDGVVGRALKGTTFPLSTAPLSDGTRTIAVVATDASGQETSSVPVVLRLDRSKPTMKTRVRGRKLEIRLADRSSGIAAESVKASLGNGRSASGRRTLKVRYSRPGRYRIVVRATDQAGNRATLRKTVVVR